MKGSLVNLLKTPDPDGVSVGIKALMITQSNRASGDLAKRILCEMPNRSRLKKLLDGDAASSIRPSTGR